MFRYVNERSPRLACAILVSSSCIFGSSVQAGGFALIEQGGSGMGNAYAGASAVSKDASTVWFNPAGMTELNSRQIAVAAHVISVESDFSDRGTTLNEAFGLAPVAGQTEVDSGGAAGVPNLYYVHPLNKKVTMGFGVSVPFGNSTDYGDNWVGRYQAVESEVTVIDLNPSIAYRVNPKLSIGGGVSVQYIDATLGSAVDSGATCLGLVSRATVDLAECIGAGLTTAGVRANDGYAVVTGDSWAATFNLGLLYKPRQGTKLGLAYRHSIDHDLDGEGEFSTNPGLAAILANRQVPLFQTTGASADADLPPSVMLSIAHEVNSKVELLADATFTGWSSLEELRVRFDNPAQPDTLITLGYEDVWRFSAGLNYQQSDRMVLRAGVAYDQDPVPSTQLRTPRIPGSDRTWVSFGLGYKFGNRGQFDVGYARLFVDDTPIDNASESAGGTTIRGVYETNVDLLSVQYTHKFN
ncbi:hypothetical protein AB833_06490 [Chromatiales bacterium (ex Bugula neritina AB1)]|nr:hypothetical protein AB833_06490 [Chromatiales bacterium (ex Bugula neritina AB1)]